MGYGDQLMATGMARGALARGKRIAFGDGRKIIWDHHSELIFRGNPNIAQINTEAAPYIEWITYYRGSRLYNRQINNRWQWNYDFKATPGEVFLSADETRFAARFGSGFVLMEPNVVDWKPSAPNKRWPIERYRAVARKFQDEGRRVVQLAYSGSTAIIDGATQIKTRDFRYAMAVLKNAALYIGPEGGLHHASAAVGVPAVVLFGGFIPPSITGYDSHTNLTGGATACGYLNACEHCKAAMEAISVAEVLDAARQYLKVAA